MFTIVGVSTLNGVTKVRFANDFVTRFKMLAKDGHININLIELPQAMTKSAAVAYIKTTELATNPLYSEAIAVADEKYNGTGPSRVIRTEKPQLSIAAILARADSQKVTE